MAKSCKTKTQTPEVFEHGWADCTTRMALDQLLRNHGFRVLSRPLGGRDLSTWQKGKKKLLFRQALKTLDKDLVQDARYAEDLYVSGISFQDDEPEE